ncbi:RNA-directed DNA polymerase, eukaryota, reverse transcriptase zinc-binding domain protein, partial [Tanacetum coccineum]
LMRQQKNIHHRVGNALCVVFDIISCPRVTPVLSFKKTSDAMKKLCLQENQSYMLKMEKRKEIKMRQKEVALIVVMDKLSEKKDKEAELKFLLFSENGGATKRGGGDKDNTNMPWVKWDTILASLDQGGLGVGSLKAFNLALLQKWRWRLITKPNSLLVKVIKAIHGVEAGFDEKGCYTNGTWADIVGSTNYLHSGNIIPKGTIRFKVGCGNNIRFWKDIWIGESPLCSRFNRLFRLDLDENCTINEWLISSNWIWHWRRSVTFERTEEMLRTLTNELRHTKLLSEPDTCMWSLSDDGLFSVAVTRRHIDQVILPSVNIATRWNTVLPKKVNIFIWRLRLDRFPHRLNLLKRGLEFDSISCPICNNHVESNDHIFFSCDVASSVWNLIRLWCHISDPQPSSCQDWLTWIDNRSGSINTKNRSLRYSSLYVFGALEIP